MSLLLLALACAPTDPAMPAEGSVAEGQLAGGSVIEKVTLDLLGDLRDRPIQGPADVVHLYGGTRMGDRVLLSGAGGLFLAALRDGVPQVTGRYVPTDGPFPDCTFVGAISDSQVLVSVRQDLGFRTALLQVTSDGQLLEVADLPLIASPTAVARHAGDILILDSTGDLWRWDLHSPSRRILTGLESPRDLVVIGDTAVVADRSGGLVTVDLSSETIIDRVETFTAPLDLERVGDTLYVAEGSSGVEIFTISDPTHPLRIGQLDSPGTAQALAVTGESLWVASMTGLAAVDISDPSHPWVAGFSAGSEFSLGVVALDDAVLALDWSYLHLARRVGEADPVLDLSQREIVISGAGELVLTNLGTETLLLGAPVAEGKGIEVGALPAALEPGETTELQLHLADGADGTIRFTSSDPDLTDVVLPVYAGSGVELAVGQAAPPVRLQDLDGVTHDLGLTHRPVVLVFFATWCPICPPELDDLETVAATLDAEIWLVASEDELANLESFRELRGITLPILVDPGGRTHEQFRQVSAFEQTLYPQNWVVGRDGTIVYAANHYEPEAIASAVANN